jgi:hypothetical protein
MAAPTTAKCPHCGKTIQLVPAIPDGELDFSVPDNSGLLALFEDI